MNKITDGEIRITKEMLCKATVTPEQKKHLFKLKTKKGRTDDIPPSTARSQRGTFIHIFIHSGGCLNQFLQVATGCSFALGNHSPKCNDCIGPCLYHPNLDFLPETPWRPYTSGTISFDTNHLSCNSFSVHVEQANWHINRASPQPHDAMTQSEE